MSKFASKGRGRCIKVGGGGGVGGVVDKRGCLSLFKCTD